MGAYSFSQNLGRTEKAIKKIYFVAVAFWLSFPSSTHIDAVSTSAFKEIVLL